LLFWHLLYSAKKLSLSLKQQRYVSLDLQIVNFFHYLMFAQQQKKALQMLLLDPREQFQKANIEAILSWKH